MLATASPMDFSSAFRAQTDGRLVARGNGKVPTSVAGPARTADREPERSPVYPFSMRPAL
jgi:hypothetical protein